ncbi:MAG: hypothetical protein KatS3mg002_0284 [Candidatus Woesearchaeota archaeon]|nr:MAG: hypothetical protein KatS3mg002_0284 [Candidatus Woesearchaeota archaeon]
MKIKNYINEIKDILNVFSEIGVDVTPIFHSTGVLTLIARMADPKILFLYLTLRSSYDVYMKYMNSTTSICQSFINDPKKYELCILSAKILSLEKRIQELEKIKTKKQNKLLERKILLLTSKLNRYKKEYESKLISI